MALEVTGRSQAEALIPETQVKEIIKELPTKSAALSLCRQVRMSTKKSSQPVLSTLPAAYWVNGDTGLKSTTKAAWEGVTMVAEELAAIAPIPEAVLSDAGYPLWDEVKPLLVEAIGAAIDAAAFFGTSKPASWTSEAIIPGALAQGNDIAEGTGEDVGVDIAEMGELLAMQGYNLRAFAGQPGLQWRFTKVRTTEGLPIYGSGDISQGRPSSLYGMPYSAVDNGSWDSSEAILVGGDFTKAVIGIRQDITFKLFTEGVISDDDGKILLNLMQQDSAAMRVVFRVGYALANPVSRLAAADERFPFAVLTPGS
jgi:HK97 family phage major capsid protein